MKVLEIDSISGFEAKEVEKFAQSWKTKNTQWEHDFERSNQDW